MRRLHLGIGLAGLIAFLATGLHMATHFPAAYAAAAEIRYLYRANHVYVLLASLINLALGIYGSAPRPGWRGKLALSGALLVLVAPIALAYAFFFEPPQGSPDRPATLIGVFLLLVGVLLQWPNRR